MTALTHYESADETRRRLLRGMISITNLASRQHHSGGRLLHIQGAPASYMREATAGHAPFLAPSSVDLARVKGWRLAREREAPAPISMDEYFSRFVRWLWAPENRGVAMVAIVGGERSVVGLGDTLVCTCSRDAAKKGKCHRTRVADFIIARGFSVVLDGRLYEPPWESWGPWPPYVPAELRRQADVDLWERRTGRRVRWDRCRGERPVKYDDADPRLQRGIERLQARLRQAGAMDE